MESYNGELRAELLDRDVFFTLLELNVLTEQYRQTYNRIRPHSSMGYQPPAPEAMLTAEPAPVLGELTAKIYRGHLRSGLTIGGRSPLPIV